MDCLIVSQVADIISSAQLEKTKKMKKTIMILMMLTTGLFCSGQNSNSTSDSVFTGNLDSVKAKVVIAPEPNGPTKEGLAKAIKTGTIYNSTSPYHNDLHEFTYSMAMRDYCTKTLSQMRANGEVDKKLSKKLEKELSNAKAELASSKYNGLKIESGQYEVFLKQINDQFK